MKEHIEVQVYRIPNQFSQIWFVNKLEKKHFVSYYLDQEEVYVKVTKKDP